MLKIAHCDDEPLLKRQLEHLLEKYREKKRMSDYDSNFEYQYMFFNTAEALLATDYVYDVLFLDIMLENGINGIDIGMKLRNKHVKAYFILLTSVTDAHEKGYKASVLRYLTKPIQFEGLCEALNTVLDFTETRSMKLHFAFKAQTFHVNVEDIIHIESYYRHQTVVTTSQKYRVGEKLEALAKRLPRHQFYLLQKSYLINFNYVNRISKTSVEMSDGTVISLTRGDTEKYENLSSAFNEFLKGEQVYV